MEPEREWKGLGAADSIQDFQEDLGIYIRLGT